MTGKNPRDKIRAGAEDVREGDGIDPREEQKDRRAQVRRGKPNYATLRLASQIKTVLCDAISQAGDARLASMTVGTVEPSASGTTFVAQVYSTNPEANYAPSDILHALESMKPGLRAEVARSVNRKSAPDFTFDVLPPRVQPR